MHSEKPPAPVVFTRRHAPLAGLLLLLGASACQPAGPAPTLSAAPVAAEGCDEAVLRTYNVPPAHSRAVERALASALSAGEDLPPRGTVEQLPNGQLVVVAPPAIQEGVAELVRGLADVKIPAARTAGFDYWVVIGEPAPEASGLDLPDIVPALTAIVREQGPMKFTSLEKISLASASDESADITGSRIAVRQVVTDVGGRLVADVQLEVDTAPEVDPIDRCRSGGCKQFRTRVNVDPGKLLVVGQTGITGPAGATRSLFYLVRGRTISGE